MPNQLDKLEAWQKQLDSYLKPANYNALDLLEKWQIQMAAYLASLPTTPPSAGGFPNHRMGVHWIPGSNRPSDHTYMDQLKPGAIKVVALDPTRIKEALGHLDPAGRSLVVVRDHPLSEQKSDMTTDPIATGKRHALNWANQFKAGGRLAGIDPSKLVFCGINEPFVHNPQEESIVYNYTKAFLEDLKIYGLRGLALNLSVGWPRNNDTATVKNTPPIWDSFRGLESVILAGGHFLGLHEYWRTDPDDSWYTSPSGAKWGWTAHRHWACPLAVPIIIGECGLSKEVNGTPAPGQSAGWIGNVPAPTYAEQLWRYADKCHPNVFAVMPFTTDMASTDWATDDTGPAHADILARRHATTWPQVWPVSTPTIPPPIEDQPMNIIFPTFTGKVTGYYGSVYKNSAGACYAHEGLDLSKPVGTPLYAPADGIVAYSDVDPMYGNYIRTYHPQLKVCFFFAHLSERKVQTGNSIKQGQLIGLTGNTGNSTGPHLHFSVRQMNAAGAYMTDRSFQTNATMDPLAWLAGWISSGNTAEEKP